MELPPLPRSGGKKREAGITPKVLEWFRLNHKTSAAIEIKATATNSIPESALEPHQRKALLDAQNGGLVWKIPDLGRRNPFDAFMLKGVPAYVVACFTKKGVCYVIPVDQWAGAKGDEWPCAGAFQIEI